MDIDSIPDMFQSKLRTAIVTALMTGEKTFRELKEITGATDGNLSVHLSRLAEAGYISIHKDIFNNKPRTRYNLTGTGQAEFIDYVDKLEQIVRQFHLSREGAPDAPLDSGQKD